MSTVFDFFLQAISGQLAAEIRINGFSVFSNQSQKPMALGARVDGFVVAGSNRLRATCRSIPLDPDLDLKPSFELQLFATPSGESRDEMDRVVFGAYAPEATRMPPEGELVVVDHVFDVPAVRTRYRFLDAMPLDDDRPARELSALVVRALDARDLTALRGLFTMRFEELCAAADGRRVDFEEGFVSPIELAMQARDYRVEAAAPAQLEVVPQWGGRVMHVRGPSGVPAVLVHGGGATVGLSWSIAVVDGKPTIVR